MCRSGARDIFNPVTPFRECCFPTNIHVRPACASGRLVAAEPVSGMGEKQSQSTGLSRNNFEHFAVIALVLRQSSVASHDMNASRGRVCTEN